MPADGELYALSPGEDGESEWVRPRPVGELVVELVTEATDLDVDDIDDLDSYVDREELQAHLDGETAEEALTFTVEGHDVVVEPVGIIDVEPT